MDKETCDFIEWWVDTTNALKGPSSEDSLQGIDPERYEAWTAFVTATIGVPMDCRLADIPPEKREIFRTGFALIWG